MAFTTPKYDSPDGQQREQLNFSTTLPERFFTGTVDPSTVDVQVSIRGGAFASDPDFIVLEGQNFTIPNPAVFPEGLGMVAGLNEIRVRAVSNTGSVSDPAVTNVRLVQEADVGLVPLPPTNVTLERFDDSVLVRVQGIDDPNFRGLNFYASQFAGGGTTGYNRINVNTVSDGEFVETTSQITTLEVDGEIVKNPDGTAVADPLFIKLKATQSSGEDLVEKLETIPDDEFTAQLAVAISDRERENTIQTEFNTLREIPETVGRIRTTIVVDEVVDLSFFSFNHNRLNTVTSSPATIPFGSFAGLRNSEPLFYVVRSIFFDSETQTEIESTNSIEVSGNPITVTALIGTFPSVARDQISLELIRSINRTRSQVKLEAGAVIRDTFVDPGSSEVERVRFLIDFLHQSQSFATLLQIDGVNQDGNPIPVAQSPRKLALKRSLFLQNNTDVQAVIDAAFERLAANYQVFRTSGDRARGEVTFFTTVRPNQSLIIPSGTIVASGSQRFRTTVDASIPIERLASFFNPVSGRFSVTVPVRAEETGSAGNVGTGQVRSIVNGPSGLSVTNTSSTFGGDDQDTNLELAERGQNRIASVDSGRERGYLNTVAGLAGVRQAFVVSSGDVLMQRDFDADFGKHTGGKVDIYIRGQNLATVTDTFAFTFETREDIQFVIVGNPKDLVFRAQDPSLTVDNPIVEVLDDAEVGFQFRNATTGEVFDLTDVQIVRFDTIQLSTVLNQPDVDFGDVVFGDYRFRSSNEFVLPRQPVRFINTVSGTESGALPTEGFSLVRSDSPLRTGNSTLATDFVLIVQVTDDTGVSVPSGDLIDVDNELHVLVGETVEFLDNLGANPLTIKVFNLDRTVQFKGPEDPSGVPDFAIIRGTQTTPVGIRRTPTSAITTGQQIVVDYRHDENFTVEYVVNNVPRLAQESIDESRHADADVIAKETVQVPLNISATVFLQQTVQQDQADSLIRANFQLFFDGLRLGVPVRQSDIIGVIESTGGVSHVVTPLSLMVRGEGAPILREQLSTTVSEDVIYVAGDPDDPISTPTVSVFLVREPMTAATSTGGGPVNEFRGVFEDDAELVLQIIRPETLGSAPGRAFIIGNDGLNIPGLTDDTTLQAEFPTASNTEIEAVRRTRTQNRIMISVSVDDNPINHDYFVTYFVAAENNGVRDIEPGPVEQLVPGELLFIFEEDRITGV